MHGLISPNPVVRFLFKFILCVLVAMAVSCAVVALRTGDPAYVIYEWISPARFHSQDRLIRAVAAQHQLDPMLVKAVVWRESRFDPQKVGTAGERGLMQVSEKAASEWAAENKVENFRADDLFEAKTNLEAGSWYLHRAMERWKSQSDPIPFALAEYNAGGSRAQRWAGGDAAPPLAAKDFLAHIDFPATRKYVESIIDRYKFYKQRGRM